MTQNADIHAPVEHRDGCLTETTWDEDDCDCRVCSTCGHPMRGGRCRWDGRVTPSVVP